MTESSAKILELQRKLDENEVALLQEQRDKNWPYRRIRTRHTGHR